MAGQYTVFTHNGYDVRCYADGTKVKQGNQLGEVDAVVHGKRLHELEAYATAAEMLIRISIILTLCVQDGHGRRQHIVRHMMVTDNEIDATLTGIRNLVHSLDAAIEHDNQFHTRFRCIVHSLAGYAIALFVAVGDVIVYVGIVLLEKPVHQSNGRAAVNIIIAIDQNTLFTAKRCIEPRHGLVHIKEQEGIKESGKLRPEKSPCFL